MWIPERYFSALFSFLRLYDGGIFLFLFIHVLFFYGFFSGSGHFVIRNRLTSPLVVFLQFYLLDVFPYTNIPAKSVIGGRKRGTMLV